MCVKGAEAEQGLRISPGAGVELGRPAGMMGRTFGQRSSAGVAMTNGASTRRSARNQRPASAGRGAQQLPRVCLSAV